MPTGKNLVPSSSVKRNARRPRKCKLESCLRNTQQLKMFFFPFSSHLLYQLLLLSNNLEIRPLERPHPGGHLLPLGVQEKSNRIVLARTRVCGACPGCVGRKIFSSPQIEGRTPVPTAHPSHLVCRRPVCTQYPRTTSSFAIVVTSLSFFLSFFII